MKSVIISIVLLIVAGAMWWFAARPQVALVNEPINVEQPLVIVTTPVPNALISSPLTITGQARGYWFFEASFPVILKDSNNNTLGQGIAQAQGDWMTENYVPFTAVINFLPPQTASGQLILQKDNPSGLPEHDDQIVIPVNF